jgi:hypothetical protein
MQHGTQHRKPATDIMRLTTCDMRRRKRNGQWTPYNMQRARCNIQHMIRSSWATDNMQMTTDATRNERHATAKAQQASLSMLPAGNAHSGDSDRRRAQPPSTQCHSGRCATCSARATARSDRSRRWRTVSRRCGASVSTGKVQRATCAVSLPCSAQHAAWRGQLAACITERASRSVAACAGCIRQTACSTQPTLSLLQRGAWRWKRKCTSHRCVNTCAPRLCTHAPFHHSAIGTSEPPAE